ncbi:MAG TPA: ABC transporter substrate-binding protein [Egibacteraceae bacterium]|nr:ABC transporter substrate-binding protein [Egibacteraceae bacterium]HVM14594.1 ABC transporter substrate-binding protein [Egibacteraceae bacterium]HVM21415.1 ABC transporter substrate-binding protein [Egibacteraceae bacterium]
MRTHVWTTRLAFLVVAAMLAAACGNGGNGEGNGGGAGGDGEGGGTVSLLHGISGEEEQAALQQAVDAFQEQTGNTVEVEASPNFETVVVTRVQGGNPPDVALYPQPGLLERVSQDATPLSEAGVDVGALNDQLVPGMVETGTFDGTEYGVVVKVGFKSLLWTAGQRFTDAGYEVPETWDDLKSLTDQIAQDTPEPGRAPWCIGIESADATGWVATDWIEDIMLRLHGPDVYDQWVNHEIQFNSDEVRAAFEELEEIWFNEEYVVGGTTGILQTPFADAVQPMNQEEPGCFLHRQAGFIEGSFEGELGTEYDVAPLPGTESGPPPALFAGDLVAVHTDNPTAGEFVEFLLSAEGQEAWMGHEGAGSLSPRADFNPESYPSEALTRQGEIFANAEFARFDASDQMPAQVGTDAFWREVVAWLSGSQDLDATLTNIDNAWPEGGEE